MSNKFENYVQIIQENSLEMNNKTDIFCLILSCSTNNRDRERIV